MTTVNRPAQRQMPLHLRGSGYEVVPYEPRFKEDVLEIQKELWSPHVESNRAYFEWKHERNPYVRPSPIFVALHEGRVVGMRSYFGVRWEAGTRGEILDGLYADDLVIDPEHRCRGLTGLIMETAFSSLGDSGWEYLFNLSAGPATTMSSLSRGWKRVGSMRPMYSRSWRLAAGARIEKALRGWSPNLFELAMSRGEEISTLSEIDADGVISSSSDTSQISFTLSPRIREMVELLDRLGTDGRIRHVRDETFFEWRFRNPLHRYGFLYCGHPTLSGYLVLQERTESNDAAILNIVDWEAIDQTTLGELLAAAKLIAGNNRVLNTWTASFSAERMALLEQEGFRPEDAKGLNAPGLLIRNIGGPSKDSGTFSGRSLMNLDDWDLRLLYSMRG